RPRGAMKRVAISAASAPSATGRIVAATASPGAAANARLATGHAANGPSPTSRAVIASHARKAIGHGASRSPERRGRNVPAVKDHSVIARLVATVRSPTGRRANAGLAPKVIARVAIVRQATNHSATSPAV